MTRTPSSPDQRGQETSAGGLGRGRRIALTVATLAALAVLLGLGTWQVQRLAWKTDLIARVEARLAAEPGTIPPPEDWAALEATDVEYRPVHVSGRFDPDREIHVYVPLTQPKGRVGGIGYFVIAPLRLNDGHVLLVNRGFVPASLKDPALRPETRPSGDRVEVTGLLRPREVRSWLAPADDPAGNVWFVRDPLVMAPVLGLDPARVAPFTLDAAAGAPGDLPQGGETVVSFSNNHLGYAITWYGLAAALVAVYASLMLRGRGRGRS